jgi:hypothetical protein
MATSSDRPARGKVEGRPAGGELAGGEPATGRSAGEGKGAGMSMGGPGREGAAGAYPPVDGAPPGGHRPCAGGATGGAPVYPLAVSETAGATPTAELVPGGPLTVRAHQTLFRSAAPRQRLAASLVRLEDGRLLLTFRMGTGPQRRNDGAIMLTSSQDGGEHWEEPRPLYAYPDWDCFPMGGLVRFAGDRLWLIAGRIKFDGTLGGDEPLDGWHTAATESRDGGHTWSELGPEIRLFPGWTELYGASNPHLLADGRYLFAATGTLGRDHGWHAGVTFLHPPGDGPPGTGFSPVVTIARAAGRNFADVDVVRLDDGRLLAIVREMVTRQAFSAHSADEGRSWSPVRPTGFMGANVKLLRLRAGAILCAYRDEDPARRGVSCSVSLDGGERWQLAGQLYRAPADTTHQPGYLCGYPDLVYTGDREIACVLHTYPDAAGRIDLHWLRLRDET